MRFWAVTIWGNWGTPTSRQAQEFWCFQVASRVRQGRMTQVRANASESVVAGNFACNAGQKSTAMMSAAFGASKAGLVVANQRVCRTTALRRALERMNAVGSTADVSAEG
jgi:hypothetical protein